MLGILGLQVTMARVNKHPEASDCPVSPFKQGSMGACKASAYHLRRDDKEPADALVKPEGS
jgi:hypothetical protein